MKNLVITGGLGFIGKNIAKFFCEDRQFDKLYIIDKRTKVSDLAFFKNFLSSDYELIETCISKIDLAKLGDNLEIINFAAESHVDDSFENAVEFTKQNMLNTHIMMENLRNSKSKFRLIHISTDEVYGGEMESMCDENAPFNPSNPYSASKAGADLLVQTYMKCYDFNSAIIRANNLYGDYQNIQKLIPKATYLSSKKKHFTLHGNGHQTRHFLHCRDFYEALTTIMDLWDSTSERLFNIAADEQISVRDLVEKIYSIQGLDTEKFIKVGPDRPFNDDHYLIDDTKLRALGWTPKINFEEELHNIISEKKFFVS